MLIFIEQYKAMVFQDGPEAPGDAQDLFKDLGQIAWLQFLHLCGGNNANQV